MKHQFYFKPTSLINFYVMKDDQNGLDSFFPKYILDSKVFDNNVNSV